MSSLRRVSMRTDAWPLFIGRFQPFHRGHLVMVKLILEEHSGIRFGIGSSQYKDTEKNPFSFEERAVMIRSTMEKEGFEDYEIVAIEDLHNDKLWVDRVADLVPDLQVVYSNDPLTIRLLQERGFDARVMPLVERDALSGTEVRKRMLEDRDWEALVPPTVRDVLVEMGGPERIRRTAGETSDTDEDQKHGDG